MKYISVSQFAKKWDLPEDAVIPEKGKNKKFSDNPLLNILKEQKDMKLKGGIYQRTHQCR